MEKKENAAKNVTAAPVQAKAQDGAKALSEEDAKKLAAFKAKKAEAAKRFKEKRQEEANKRVENGKALIQHLQSNGLWDKLTPELQGFLTELSTPRVITANGTSSIFVQLFGADAKVGDSVTLLDAMKRTFKGLAPLQKLCKDWQKKGTVVEFTSKPKMEESTFTIKQLGTAAPADAAE